MVLVHLAERDEIGPGHLKMFENMMTEAGKSVEAHWYAGDHYFPFPAGASYDNMRRWQDCKPYAG